MKMRVILLLMMINVLLLAVTTLAIAQDRAGTSAAPELLIPLGAKEVAMSGATVSSASGVSAIYWNPAGLDMMDVGASAIFSHRSYIADIGINYIALASKFSGFGSVGLTLRSFGIGDINVTTEDQTDGTGEIISPTFFTLGLTYSKQLTDNVSVGATVNIVNESFARVSASGIAVDAGVQYQNLGGLKGLGVGVCVKNIGTTMQYGGSGLWVSATDPSSQRGLTQYKVEAASYQMPSVIEIGLGYNTEIAENINLLISGAFENDNYGLDKYRIGGEVSYMKSLFLRAGYLYSTNLYGNESIFQNITFGFGIDLKEYVGIPMGFDYAYVPVKYFDANHLFDIRIDF
jgi:hypothetical protein